MPIGTSQTFDHPTVRGDLCLTTNTTGTQVGALRTYGPYGEPGIFNTDNDGLPDNQPGHMDYGWLGQHQRPCTHRDQLGLQRSHLCWQLLRVQPVVFLTEVH
ncbi:hypothetical protein SAMN05216174_10338 [Actinokineospora iranica]|uniref:Uncharacterized protein n=1 Tax=Actinokineospora iranica TaxID=1271860 RepID=A0A1G6MVM6_9PSEU|nr:hypothetical protein SAMN05216174_10338 [Actinokineospora iranica]